MYVRARLSDPSKALVEIGTGYFAEMDREKAIEFFNRKQKYLSEQVCQASYTLFSADLAGHY